MAAAPMATRSAVATRRVTLLRDDLLALARLAPERYPFLLESGSAAGQGWDLLLAFPGAMLRLDADGRVSGPHAGQRFLDSLDAWWRAERAERRSDGLPFAGGWFLFLAYELAAEIEPRLELPRDARLPVALAVRCPVAVLVERSSGAGLVVAEDGHQHALEQVVEDLAAARGLPPPAPLRFREPLRDDDGAAYRDAVRRAQHHIHQGDVFQVNLARAWSGAVDGPCDAGAAYAALRAGNPAPFAGLARLPGATLVSSSPERLVEVRDRRIQTRPIAGTRRRDGDPLRDGALRAELVASEKERAEHVMLIDLERNDLSRVARPGSVEVTELMSVESYATVHHIVSNVAGTLREGVTPGATIAAVFPGGTITGCPKVRCMEIIAALEGRPRGAYTGSMGYLDRSGDLDLNILIRTLLVHDLRLELMAGAGIVADSDPDRELAETRHKARGLTRALGAEGA
jgi:anthranilate synthase component 1